jgi:hypothetical protein
MNVVFACDSEGAPRLILHFSIEWHGMQRAITTKSDIDEPGASVNVRAQGHMRAREWLRRAGRAHAGFEGLNGEAGRRQRGREQGVLLVAVTTTPLVDQLVLNVIAFR